MRLIQANYLGPATDPGAGANSSMMGASSGDAGVVDGSSATDPFATVKVERTKQITKPVGRVGA